VSAHYCSPDHSLSVGLRCPFFQRLTELFEIGCRGRGPSGLTCEDGSDFAFQTLRGNEVLPANSVPLLFQAQANLLVNHVDCCFSRSDGRCVQQAPTDGLVGPQNEWVGLETNVGVRVLDSVVLVLFADLKHLLCRGLSGLGADQVQTGHESTCLALCHTDVRPCLAVYLYDCAGQ